MRHSWRRAVGVGVLAVPLVSALAPAQRGGRGGAPVRPPEPPRFQLMGPASGGRIAAVAGVPGDTLTYYFGAASGGVWKTTDGGNTAIPVSDSMPVAAIGALAVAPSNPNIVWAGTGEAWAIRDADVAGDGIYKSTDAGRTWKNMGLRNVGRIGKVVVHPTNPDVVYVCALGFATGPQEERGVYVTKDGGATWTRSLFVDKDTGCSGLALDVKNPNVLFAGMWQVVMHTYAMFSGGPSSAVYKSTDAGATWKKLEHPGLPKPPVGKIDVAVAPSSSSRVYALIQTANQGSLWRSDDGGDSWRVTSWDRRLIGRAGYYIRIAVNPANENEVLIASSSFHRSTDGGLTFPPQGGGGGGGGCGDCHDIWMDPKNPDHWAQTGDAGVGLTRNHGRSFVSVALPIAQMYHVATDNQVPYWVYGNRQDDGTFRGPSTVPEAAPAGPSGAGMRGLASIGALGAGGFGGRGGGGGGGGGRGGGGRGGRGGAAPTQPDTTAGARPDSTSARAVAAQRGQDTTAVGAFFNEGGFGVAAGSTWEHNIGGCESGFTLPDLNDPNIIWASCYGNKVTRYDHRTGIARAVAPWMISLDSPPNKTKYRCHWTPPLAIDPFDTKTVYYGCQVIFKTSNGGQSWTVISPDLSTRDSTRIIPSGGIIEDNLGQFYGEVVFAIAPSEIQRGLIWAGTNDGKVWYTRDGGTTWNDVTKNMTAVAPWGTIRKIEPSPFDPATAYVAIDYHMMDDRRPYVLKTTDFGKTWTNITGALPTDHPLDYVMAVTENPNRKGMLFVGTGHAFYYSMDDGEHWTQFKDGLPASPVSWVVVQKQAHDVVASTYGRGIYILKDITMMEQADKAAAATADVYLYAPRPAFRLARGGTIDINYAIKSAPTDSVKVEILDGLGKSVRTIRQMGRSGLNRTTWDLRLDGPRQPELRTTPPDNPHIWEEPPFKGKPFRPVNHWGIQGPQTQGPLAVPGKYAVRVTVNGKSYTQPLDVRKDPSITSTVTDLALSTRTQARIRDDINQTVEMINKVEVMRRQIEDQLKAGKASAEQQTALHEMDKKMLDVELRLLSRTELHSDDKWYVEPYKLYLNLVWLSGEVGSGAGDVAGGADYRPTDTSIQVLTNLEQELTAAKAAYKKLMEVDVPAFNKTMAGGVTITME